MINGLPVMVPGWMAESNGDPAPADVSLWQSNNGLKPDGIAGPITRGACWRTDGKRLMFATSRYPEPDSASKRWASAWVHDRRSVHGAFARSRLSIQPAQFITLCRFVSSEWSTGLDYLSGRDGVTIGFRRWAAGGWRGILKNLGDAYLRTTFGEWGAFQLRASTFKGLASNGWPLSDPYLRAGFLVLAADRFWWHLQLEDTVSDVAELLDRFPWRRGRTIAKAFRALNSAPGYVYGWKKRGWGALDNDSAYAEKQLDSRYAGASEGKRRRFEAIEAVIKRGELWR